MAALFQKSTLDKIIRFENGKAIKPGGNGMYEVYGANGIIGGSDNYRHENAVIIGRVGACGSTYYCPRKFWASDNTIVAGPRDGNNDIRFLYYLLTVLNLHRWAGGAAQPLLTQTVLKQVEVSVPSLMVQRRIAYILGAYDDLIENNLRRIRILEEIARLLYKEWFVDFRFPGHEKHGPRPASNDACKPTRPNTPGWLPSPLGPIPNGWEVRNLEDIAEVNGRSIGRNNVPDRIVYVDIQSVSPGRIDAMDSMDFESAPGRARRIVRHGDTIWSCVRPNRKSYALVVAPPEDLIVSTGFAVLSPLSVPFTYLYHAVTTDEFVGYLTNHATGSAYPAVTGQDFKNADLLCPSGSLLSMFHDAVEPMLLNIHNLLKRNANLRQTRDLLLPKLISGDIELSSACEAVETHCGRV